MRNASPRKASSGVDLASYAGAAAAIAFILALTVGAVDAPGGAGPAPSSSTLVAESSP